MKPSWVAEIFFFCPILMGFGLYSCASNMEIGSMIMSNTQKRGIVVLYRVFQLTVDI